MPRRKPYHPYRNIRLNRRPLPRQTGVISQRLPENLRTHSSPNSAFALFVIICAFAMIIGGLVYMLTNNSTDIDLMKSLVQ